MVDGRWPSFISWPALAPFAVFLGKSLRLGLDVLADWDVSLCSLLAKVAHAMGTLNI